ncbi:MAG: hypothetical protein ABL930_07235 [Pseudobdellovibrio sp.]
MKTIISFLAALLLVVSVKAGYVDKLKDLQGRLDVKFCSILTDVQKIQVVNQLHNFLAQTSNQYVYGKEKLVQAVYIDCPDRYPSDTKTQANARLRGHSLIVNFDLSSLPIFEARIALEEKILEQLNIQIDALYSFKREVDSLTGTTGSNQSYLELVNQVLAIVPVYVSTDLRSQLDQIIITDSISRYNRASAALVPAWYVKNKKSLLITVGHVDAGSGDQLAIGAAGINALVKAVTQNGFTSIDTLLVDTEEVESTLVNFGHFLTPEVESLLAVNNVKNITFKANPETAQNLFTGTTLTLGTTVEKMNFVVDLLFR